MNSLLAFWRCEFVFVPFTVQEGLGHGNNLFCYAATVGDDHMLLYSEQTALYGRA